MPGPRGPGGYRRLVGAPEGAPVLRRDLGVHLPSGVARSLVNFVQLSDLHVTDAQSPARAEFLDRLGDVDQPSALAVGRVGTYRAQEALTHQVLEAMVRAVRSEGRGPLTGAPVSFAISTGDNIDNGQDNELRAYLALLNGGTSVVPDSGDPARYDGVGAQHCYDVRYYHPDGTPPGERDDCCRAGRGFPLIPGLLDAARRPLAASGLGISWYAVYGNHDALIGGTMPPEDELVALALGGRKPIAAPEGIDLVAPLADNEFGPPAGVWGMAGGATRPVAADASRRPVGAKEWIAAHLCDGGSPVGHGFGEGARDTGRAHYAFSAGGVRFVVLDTVNRAGGWQGSLDRGQLEWLEAELTAVHGAFFDDTGRRRHHGAADQPVIVCSHHTLETMTNPWAPDGARRVLGPELARLLARFPNVVAWLNGHTHAHRIVARPAAAHLSGVPGGYFEITTASHIDWPQQARLVEVAIDDDQLVLATGVPDHAGARDGRSEALDEPVALAGWSRELALNAWQGLGPDGVPLGAGRVEDRDVLAVLPLRPPRWGGAAR